MFILGFDVIVDSTGTGGRGFQCVIITEGSFKSPQGWVIKPTRGGDAEPESVPRCRQVVHRNQSSEQERRPSGFNIHG